MMIAVIGLLIACGNQDEVASSNGAVRVGAVASADEDARVGTVASVDEDVQSNQVEHWDESTLDDEIAPRDTWGEGFLSIKRRIPAPLRLRIFNASAIVRATLISSSPATVRYSEATGFDVDKDDEDTGGSGVLYPVDGEYRAVHSFRFRVSEYLKGSGASEITVRAMRSGSHGTEAEALQVATDSLGERDTSRDAHEALLFLWEPTPDDTILFLRSGPYPWLHYTIDTLNRVWLPAQDPPAAAGASSSDNSSPLFLMGEQVSGLSWPTTMSLGELRS